MKRESLVKGFVILLLNFSDSYSKGKQISTKVLPENTLSYESCYFGFFYNTSEFSKSQYLVTL